MTTDFQSMGLHPEILQALTERGYTEATPIQSSLIPVMLTGKDVIGQAQTGTGKTAAFALPIIHNLEPGHKSVQALVLTPTRELALQVGNAVNEYGRHRGVDVLSIYGGQSYTRQITRLKRGVDVVVGTPGRLLDLINRKLLDLSHVKTVVLDEADEMLSMGFVEDIESILSETPTERQTALFSATMPAEIRRLAEKYMHAPESIMVKREHMTVDAIEQRYYMVHESDKTAALTRLFEMEDITSALIFVRTRAGTTSLSSELNQRGLVTETLNGDLSQEARERTLGRFRSGHAKVLVATDVAARGLDIDDISHVFNFDLPDDPEIYVHRIGRTGRAGKKGIAISLVSPFERRRLRQIEGFSRKKLNLFQIPSEEDILVQREEKLVKQVTIWMERGRFKREREIVERLIAEGHDPVELAAAALKVSRGEEKQRPIYAVKEVQEREPRKFEGGGGGYRDVRGPRTSMDSGQFRKRNSAEKISHEHGMVRLSMNVGKAQGIRPSDIVGTIAFHADIPGRSIGKIFIQDKVTFVDIPENIVSKVLSKNGEFRFNKQPVIFQKADK